jgi:hypothetical protein
MPGRWVFQASIKNFLTEAAQTHFWCAQMNITRPIYAVSMHNFAPKGARVIKTRGLCSMLLVLWLFIIDRLLTSSFRRFQCFFPNKSLNELLINEITIKIQREEITHCTDNVNCLIYRPWPFIYVPSCHLSLPRNRTRYLCVARPLNRARTKSGFCNVPIVSKFQQMYTLIHVIRMFCELDGKKWTTYSLILPFC